MMGNYERRKNGRRRGGGGSGNRNVGGLAHANTNEDDSAARTGGSSNGGSNGRSGRYGGGGGGGRFYGRDAHNSYNNDEDAGGSGHFEGRMGNDNDDNYGNGTGNAGSGSGRYGGNHFNGRSGGGGGGRRGGVGGRFFNGRRGGGGGGGRGGNYRGRGGNKNGGRRSDFVDDGEERHFNDRGEDNFDDRDVENDVGEREQSNRGRGGVGVGKYRGFKSGYEIGMYYKQLSLNKKREQQLNPEKQHIEYGATISIPAEVMQQVKTYLNAVKKEDEVRVTRDFDRHFEHLINESFEEFLQNSKKKAFPTLGQMDTFDYSGRSVTNTSFVSRVNDKREPREERRNMSLPVMGFTEDILKAIRKNQVVLIAGDTGCGKTTQIPQMILDDFMARDKHTTFYEIVCTQPRRISAISVAERVAYERFEEVGESVGYQIRLEYIFPQNPRSIKYCTTGILLQRMQHDLLLKGLNVVILDEIHERTIETDLLMCLFKKILPHRPDLRLILMSATVREEDFCAYFDNCYTFRIPGTVFPVEMIYLEDILQETRFDRFDKPRFKDHRSRSRKRQIEYEAFISPYLATIRRDYDRFVLEALNNPDSEGCFSLAFIEYLIFYICRNKPPGAILVFLPGYDQISKLFTNISKPTQSIGVGVRERIELYPLHSMMPNIQQKSVFLPPPKGVRKVILATNIAETSITIDDVVYVINPGRTKRSMYDVKANLETLEETWVTKANTLQRKGRAGRVQPGVCYNLFTKARENVMEEIPPPEIVCSKLEGIILNLKLLHVNDITGFMNSLISPPEDVAIQNGIRLLKRIEAINDKEYITPLGMHLARLPIDPQTGKMVLMGALFRCIDPISTVGATLSFKSPFHYPLGAEKEVETIKHNLGQNLKSDHLLYHNILKEYRKSIAIHKSWEFCNNNYMSFSTLEQLICMKQQFTRLLKNARFLESDDCTDDGANINSDNIVLLRAIIGAGLYPNMAYLKKIRMIRNHVRTIHSLSTPEDRKVSFHPSSLNSGGASFDTKFFVYFRKQRSSNVFLMDSTMVYPIALLIFGDKVEYGVSDEGVSHISVGNAYYFKCDKETADLVLHIKKCFEWLMKKKALQPSTIRPHSSEENVITAIQLVLSLDDDLGCYMARPYNANNSDQEFSKTEESDSDSYSGNYSGDARRE